MSSTTIKVFQTTEHRGNVLGVPIYADTDQDPKLWLGDAYYFWQDEEFAYAWGYDTKCRRSNWSGKFDIYTAELFFNSIEDELIDTVFNENDYRNFLMNIEKFAKVLTRRLKEKPTLEMFNDFIKDKNIWNDVKAIRFQDLPANDEKEYLALRGFFYKKRIQFAIFDKNIINNFALLVTEDCLS